MKFMTFSIYGADQIKEASRIGDTLAKSPPQGIKYLAKYACLSNPFPGRILPPNAIVTMAIVECDSDESMAAVALQWALAGIEVIRVPIMEAAAVDGASEMVEILLN